jgi:hypothetical protein
MTGPCSKSTKLWIASILAIIIIGALTAYACTSEQNALKGATDMGMKSTVGVMATQIQASDIAGLQPGDEMNPQYLAVANHLQAMRSMDDNILNAYILKVYPNRTAVFIVDDLYPDDPLGSTKIGEVSTAPDTIEMFGALSGPTVSKQPYTTKYGSFMSAYAPIDDSVNDSTGNTAAVLAIDVSAKNYNGFISQSGLPILITGLVSMILAVGAIFFFGTRKEERDEG